MELGDKPTPRGHGKSIVRTLFGDSDEMVTAATTFTVASLGSIRGPL